jgi:hypothetical protein
MQAASSETWSDLAEVHARGLDVLREAAVDAEAVLPDLGAERVSPRATERAASARHVEVHNDAVAGRETAHEAAHLRHFTRDLVAHEWRRLRMEGTLMP